MMAETESRQFSLSDRIITLLNDYRVKYYPNLNARGIAKAVEEQSNYYIKYPMGKTPWKEESIQIAQIFYYLPLNYLRNLAVANEICKRYPELSQKQVVDFGAGLGAASSVVGETLKPKNILAVEISENASSLSRQIG
ncbi:MAG: hypothetical protein KDD37_03745, partial [Bdellovibrionales bacterium]|nr:hypothetical protein [Bdellovibrionales bacterium]